MLPDLSPKGLVGVALMLVACAGFLAGILSPELIGRAAFTLGVAAVLLAAGTYLVGTDVGGGRAV